MWHTVDIAGKRTDVFEPDGRPRFGLLFLHGIGGETLHDNSTFTKLFASDRLAVVSPHGGRCWWADKVCAEFDPRLTAEQHLLTNVVPYFGERWGLAPPSLGLFGISMGGQGALRLAFKHSRILPVVAGIASALDFQEAHGQGTPLDDMYDSREHCRQDSAILHIHPSHFPPHIFFCVDPGDATWYRGNDRLHEKLAALGVPHELDLTTQAGGHSWDYFNHMAERTVRFLVSGLEKESRRLL
jgi:S-formylglutathione hydrolase